MKASTIILSLILITIAIGCYIFLRSVHRLLQPLTDIEKAPQRQIEKITSPTPTIIPDPVTIVREVRSLSRLETASYSVEKVITAQSRQGALSFLVGDRLILVAHGRVIAGVDLSKLEENDVVVNGDTVEVTLPQPEIFIATLSAEKSYVYNRRTGVIGMNPDLETEARRAAEDEIRVAALKDGILDMAQRNAEVYVRQLILMLGFEKVSFTAPMPDWSIVPPIEGN